MAERIEEFPAGTRHPWGEWLDGQVWKLTPGVDFTASTESMRVSAHRAAARRGVRVRATCEGGDLILQAYNDERGGP